MDSLLLSALGDEPVTKAYLRGLVANSGVEGLPPLGCDDIVGTRLQALRYQGAIRFGAVNRECPTGGWVLVREGGDG